MPKNRDYTGLVRTPSSMAWLIRERASLAGQIAYLERKRVDIRARLAVLRSRLKALDAVFPLHEVQVQPRVIKAVRPRAATYGSMGSMTRYILRHLREAGDIVYTSEIALGFARDQAIDLDIHRKSVIVDRVASRLRTLAQRGVICRHHASQTRAEGRWSLATYKHQDKSLGDSPHEDKAAPVHGP